jgi:Tfp pilus assembly protein PilF
MKFFIRLLAKLADASEVQGASGAVASRQFKLPVEVEDRNFGDDIAVTSTSTPNFISCEAGNTRATQQFTAVVELGKKSIFSALILLTLSSSMRLLAKENAFNPEAAHRVAAEATKKYTQQQLAEAEKGFQEAIRLDPNNVEYLNRLASVKTRLGKSAEAELLLKESIQHQLENPTAWLLLGMNELEEHHPEKAFASLVQAVLYDPKNAHAQNYLGIAAERNHWNDISESSLRKAVELDPNYADAHFNLAVYYLELKPPLPELARRHYQRALDLGTPHDPKIDTMLKPLPTQ